MTGGFKKWIQRSAALENPNRGPAMSTCGNESTWDIAPTDDAHVSHVGHSTKARTCPTTRARCIRRVQVFGANLSEIEEAAIAIERAFRSTGDPYIDVVVNREEAARHGLTVGDVNDALQSRSVAWTCRKRSKDANAIEL